MRSHYFLLFTFSIVMVIVTTGCHKPKGVLCTHQNYLIKDSTIYKIDTVYIYKYITIDTVYGHQKPTADPNSSQTPAEQHAALKKGKLEFNTSNLGIGPSFGAYYSPFNGFDMIVGFSVQYFLTSLPVKWRRAHMAMHHNRVGRVGRIGK